ncbi:family drug resistance transporter [Lichtheimia corymbifera JMRC:FSU:9682]|uniref:Family drug resistance transporter n=1 Tax=Lichtheimia corymbifera JMRC:FSU:9682 TaxID=1263082 RepID=A0A068SEZ5_9FUNG|nr:family drug resistance transporter [Lichtheimia corymbifera JMRC:FSU:9682]
MTLTAASSDNSSIIERQTSNGSSSIETHGTAVCAYQEQITTSSQAPANKHSKNNTTLIEKTKQSLPTLLSSSSPWMNKVQRGFVYIGLFMGIFAIIVQSSIVAPAMSKIATEMHDIGNQTWVAVAYFLGLNCAQAIAGKFVDIFGRKPIMLFGQSFFSIGSLICALAPTMNGLIAGRAISGFGGGSVISLAFVIAADITPLEHRPRINSALSMVYGLAAMTGPLMGGAFVDQVTYRWDFWLNLILGCTSLIIMAVFFKESNTTLTRDEPLLAKIKRIDGLGVILSAGTITCILCALNWGPMHGWGDGHTIGAFVATGVSLLALIIVEMKVAKEPIFPPQLLKNPKVSMLYLYMWCLGFGFVGIMFFGPITYQSVFGSGSTMSSVRLIPYFGALIIGALTCGQLLQWFPYPKVYMIIAGTFVTLGFSLFQLTNENSNWGHQACFFILSGFGFGFSQQNVILTVQSIAGKQYLAIATALVNFFLLLASPMGLAIYEAVFTAFRYAQFEGLPSDVLEVAQEYNALENYLYIRNVPAEYQPPLVHAYMQAVRNVFIFPAVAGGIILIVALISPNVRLGGPPPTTTAKGIKKDIEASQFGDKK